MELTCSLTPVSVADAARQPRGLQPMSPGALTRAAIRDMRAGVCGDDALWERWARTNVVREWERLGEYVAYDR